MRKAVSARETEARQAATLLGHGCRAVSRRRERTARLPVTRSRCGLAVVL